MTVVENDMTIFGWGVAYDNLGQETFAPGVVFRSSALCLSLFILDVREALNITFIQFVTGAVYYSSTLI